MAAVHEAAIARHHKYAIRKALLEPGTASRTRKLAEGIGERAGGTCSSASERLHCLAKRGDIAASLSAYAQAYSGKPFNRAP